jgi:hypothetical protein
MLSQALPSRARHILLPYARSSHRGLSWHAPAPTYGDRPRHGDEEGRAIKVTVWWDFVMCRLPPGASPVRFGPRVTAALRGAGIRGPVEINAFGDVSLLSRDEQVALADTGVNISHVPSGCVLSTSTSLCGPAFRSLFSIPQSVIF